MKVTFKPTNYEFTFEDKFFVQAAIETNSPEREHKFLACFAELSEAMSYADRLVSGGGIVAAWVFSRDAQIHSAYAER